MGELTQTLDWHNGLEISRYQNSGDPVLVFLHEGLGCISQWHSFPQQVIRATGMSGLAYSRRGYGNSSGTELPRPSDYHSREATGDLKAVLALLGNRDIILLGHSDGATIATCYAALIDDPRLVGLILVSPHFVYEEKATAPIAQMRHRFVTGDLRARLAKYHGSNVDCAFWGWCDRWLDPSFHSWTITNLLSKIEVPALYLQGEEDKFATLVHRAFLLKYSQSEVTSLIVPNAGHFPHLTAEAVDGIVRFIRTL